MLCFVIFEQTYNNINYFKQILISIMYKIDLQYFIFVLQNLFKLKSLLTIINF